MREILKNRPSPLLLIGAAVALLVCAALAIHIAHTLFGFGHPAYDFLIEEWVYGFVTVTAAVATLTRAIAKREGRWAWAMIGVGLTFWAASDLYWSLQYAELDEAPFPSICDAGYLLGYAFNLAGVAGLVRGRVSRMTALVWADVAIASLCVAAIGTTVLMDFVLDNTTGTALEIAVALAYPVLDLATLALAVAALALTGFRPGFALGFVAAGVALSGVGDATYTYQSLAGTYDAASWINSLWPVGVTLIAAAAMVPDAVRRTATRPESWRSFAAPAIFALAMLTLIVLTKNQQGNALVVGLTGATLVAIVGRLALTFRENRRLVSALQRDGLTRLGNRSKLLVDLGRIFDERPSQPHLLAILDLDGFKGYNDAFGHPAGDSLLTRLAGRLADAVEGQGFAYRLGGDEFAVLAPGDQAMTAELAQACGEALSESGEGFHVTSSLGSAEIPREATNASNALQLSDQRMYANKDSRRPSPGREVEAVLVRVLQHRAPELGAHGRAVTKLTAKVGAQLGIPESEAIALAHAAELHDVGKMAIPDAILHKPGPLDDDEWEFMYQHTILGERMLSAAPSLAAVGKLVRSTHERWDGKGYPDGLSGEEIPFAARIIFVCDAYDAMVTKRPYAEAASHESALAELRNCAGTMFDPEVVEAFCVAMAEPPSDEPDVVLSNLAERDRRLGPRSSRPATVD